MWCNEKIPAQTRESEKEIKKKGEVELSLIAFDDNVSITQTHFEGEKIFIKKMINNREAKTV